MKGSSSNFRYRIIMLCVMSLACMHLAYLVNPVNTYHNPTGPSHPHKGDFDSDAHTFTIVHFTDLHFGEHDETEALTIQAMTRVLMKEPEVDLVVFGGDQVSGYNLNDSRGVHTKWLASLETVADLWHPFVTIFGNHDDQPFVTVPLPLWRICIVPALVVSLMVLGCVMLITELKGYTFHALTVAVMLIWLFLLGYPSTVMRRSMVHYERAHFGNHSRTRDGAAGVHGLSNYFIKAQHKENKNHSVLIFLLDTGGGRLEEKYTDRQLEWVRSVSREHPHAQSIAFAHIPSYEFKKAETATTTGAGGFECFGNEHTEPGEYAGWESTPPMASLAASRVRAVFFGHNHRNSHCCMPHQGVAMPTMCYGRHSGYGGYGNWSRGARVIQTELVMGDGDKMEETEIKTWLRMEDGSQRDYTTIYRG